MGQTINVVAFPVPELPRKFYEEDLLKRKDLVWLQTNVGETIPACYVKVDNLMPNHIVRTGSFKSGSTQSPAKASRTASKTSSCNRMTLLYSHGNAEDLGLHLDLIDALARATGADVFSYEYVGYSLSRLTGAVPSEEACIRSIDAAWRYCVDKLELPPETIVIYGRSIGSGPAVDLASRKRVDGSSFSPLDAAGVLLQSPLESGACAVLGPTTSWLGYRLDIFKNYEKISNIRAPVAIMHGTQDQVIPVRNGKNLYELLQPSARYDPLWLQGYGHNDMPPGTCFNYAKRFVDSLQSRQDRRKGNAN